jgi:hypothetical protein
MLFHLALLAAVAPFGTFASPFDAKHSNGLRIRQDEAVAVDVPTDTELDTTEPEDIDPHTDVENVEMIGDLRNGATTPVGNSIMNILLGREKAETRFERAYRPPGSLKSKACKADTCKRPISICHSPLEKFFLTLRPQAVSGPTSPPP